MCLFRNGFKTFLLSCAPQPLKGWDTLVWNNVLVYIANPSLMTSLTPGGLQDFGDNFINFLYEN